MDASSRGRRGRRQVFSTYLATLSIMVGRLILYKWSPDVFDEENFALYVISLRGLSLGYLALGPALVTGLTYTVALTLKDPEEDDGAYFWSAHSLTLLWFLPFFLWVVLAPGTCAELAFGSAIHAPLMLPLLLCLLGQYWSITALAFKLGKTQVLEANAISVVMGCFVPVACLAYFQESALQQYWAMAAAFLILGILVNIWVFALGIENRARSTARFKKHAQRLYRYSLPRTPAAAGLALILALPVLLPTHYTENLAIGAIFAAGGALINIASSAIQPLAMVLLPHATQMIAQGQSRQVRQKSLQMLTGLSVASILAMGSAVLATPWILKVWLGPEALAYSSFWIGLTPAILPIVLYRAFASLINAASPKPYDSWNVVLAVLTFGLIHGALSAFAWETRLLTAFNISLYVLALLTVWRTLKLLRDS